MTAPRSEPDPAAAPPPPGPRGSLLLGCLGEFRADPLGFVERVAEEYGDLARVRVGLWDAYLVRHPDDLQRVLERQTRRFPKETDPLEVMRLLLGEGLVSAVGERWQAQRRMLQGVFRRENVAAFAPVVAGEVSRMLERWEVHAASGEDLDVAAETMRLTFGVAGRAFFSADLDADAPTFREALEVLHDQTEERLLDPVRLPLWVPTRKNRAFHGALRALDAVVYRLIRERRAAKERPPDILTGMLEAEDPETGTTFDDRLLRDQIMTLLIAGHETTSNALAWTLYLLGRHPEVEARVRAEALAVLEDRDPTPDDLPALEEARKVFLESLRLYPTTWMLLRACAEDTVLRGYRVPRGGLLALSPWVVHRHPDFWDVPERFDPERFTPEAEAARHRFAYMPFSGGPRACLGAGLAVLEAQLVLSMVLRRYTLELVPEHPVTPRPLIALAPAQGVRMRLRAAAAPPG